MTFVVRFEELAFDALSRNARYEGLALRQREGAAFARELMTRAIASIEEDGIIHVDMRRAARA